MAAGSNQSCVALLRLHAHGRVLDIGCADRWAAAELPAGCEYLGIDYPTTGRMYVAVPDIFADAGCLPLQDGSIDTVVLFEVLEHLAKPQHALAEIHRVLRPGGKLLLTVPFLYPVHDAPHDFQRYTSHGLAREAEACQLRVEDIQPMYGSAQSAGLLMSLSLGGMLMRAWTLRRPALVLAPFVLLAIPSVNLTAWLCGALFPSWDALTAGYSLVARKK